MATRKFSKFCHVHPCSSILVTIVYIIHLQDEETTTWFHVQDSLQFSRFFDAIHKNQQPETWHGTSGSKKSKAQAQRDIFMECLSRSKQVCFKKDASTSGEPWRTLKWLGKSMLNCRFSFRAPGFCCFPHSDHLILQVDSAKDAATGAANWNMLALIGWGIFPSPNRWLLRVRWWMAIAKAKFVLEAAKQLPDSLNARMFAFWQRLVPKFRHVFPKKSKISPIRPIPSPFFSPEI